MSCIFSCCLAYSIESAPLSFIRCFCGSAGVFIYTQQGGVSPVVTQIPALESCLAGPFGIFQKPAQSSGQTHLLLQSFKRLFTHVIHIALSYHARPTPPPAPQALAIIHLFVSTFRQLQPINQPSLSSSSPSLLLLLVLLVL